MLPSDVKFRTRGAVTAEIYVKLKRLHVLAFRAAGEKLANVGI